jgi:hypothetical protein
MVIARLRHCPRICLVILRRTTKYRTVSVGVRTRDLPVLVRALPLEPACWVVYEYHTSLELHRLQQLKVSVSKTETNNPSKGASGERGNVKCELAAD